MERAEIAGPIDDDGVAGIDQAAREQIESLLRAGEDEDVLRLAAEALRDGFAQHRQSFGRAWPHARRTSRLSARSIDAAVRVDRKHLEGRHAGRHRNHARIGRVTEQIADGAESLDRAAAAATLPRHANGAPEASGAAETNVPRPT